MNASAQKTRDFIYRNARPLDLARWRYHFEDGGREDVLAALASYQNADGGFANALEPDCWNPSSTPMQTWAATAIIKEIGLEDREHPIIKGILRYLASGAEFDGRRWHGLGAVKSNDGHPHAPWWSYSCESVQDCNPSASLAGFILKYAGQESPLRQLASELIIDMYGCFKTGFPLESMHECACFVELYEYLNESDARGLVDMSELRRLLQRQIKLAVCNDTESWGVDYVCKPSLFIKNKQSDFYIENKEICGFERDFIEKTQNADGTWDITWSWSAYLEQWAISKNWWKSDIIIKNMLFLKEMQQ